MILVTVFLAADAIQTNAARAEEITYAAIVEAFSTFPTLTYEVGFDLGEASARVVVPHSLLGLEEQLFVLLYSKLRSLSPHLTGA
jgi:hypothetical protein